MNKHKVLLIWNSFDEEELEFYLIPEPPDWLFECHNHYIGGAKEPKAENQLRLSDALNNDAKYWSNPEDPLCGMWVKHKLNTEDVLSLGEVQLVVTGAVV